MRQVNVSADLPGTTISQVGFAANPYIPGYTSNATRFQSVLVSGNRAYVASGGGTTGTIIATTLTIYDISNPAVPVALGYIVTSASIWTSGPVSWLNAAYQLAIKNNVIFVASSGGIRLYSVDVSDPYNPRNIGSVSIANSPGSLYGISVKGNYAYLATQNKGLTVVDISNPLSMTQVYQEGGTLNKSLGIFTVGNYAYTTNYQTTSPWTVRYLKIWDITVPTAPVLKTTYSLPAGTKPGVVSVRDNYAYVSDLNTSSVQIVDISNPLVPVYKSSLQASATFNVMNHVQLSGNYGYVTSGGKATYGGAIDVFDITNVLAPVKIYTMQQGVPTDVFGAATLVNNTLWIADYGTAAVSQTYLRNYSTLTTYTGSINSINITLISVQISNVSVGASGAVTIQGSEDNTNFTDIIGASVQVSGPGVYLVPTVESCYSYLRVSYTGLGSCHFQLKGIGV